MKFILVGDVAVGKTSLLKSFENGTFESDHEPTIGLAYSHKNIRVNGEEIQIQIWDTAGQEEYRAITKSYYRNSACVILVFDLTNIRSFKNLDNWLKDIHNNTHDEIVLTLVGNKSDCDPNQRSITWDMANRYATMGGMQYIETSARSNSNVKDVFEQSLFKVMEGLRKGRIQMDESGTMGVFQQELLRDSQLTQNSTQMNYTRDREEGERKTTRFEKNNGGVLLEEKKNVICGARNSDGSGGCC